MALHSRHDGVVLSGYRGRHFCRLRYESEAPAIWRNYGWFPKLPQASPSDRRLTGQIFGFSAILILMVWAWLLQDGVSTDTLVWGGGGTVVLGSVAAWLTKVLIPAIEKARADHLDNKKAMAQSQHDRDIRIAELEAQVEESRNAAILDLKNSTTEMSQSVRELIKEIRENSSRQQERLERFVNQTDERFSAHSAQLGAVSALAHDAQHSARPAV